MTVTGRPAPIPHVALAHLPTPLEPLTNLSKALGGPRIWVKRDDATGLAFGGNKARKLEYLMADAIEQRADVVLTTGAMQSNHCRQTAAAAARLGVECELLLEDRFADWPNAYRQGGNRFLDDLVGARVTEYEVGTDMTAALEQRAGELRAAQRNPYIVAMGGSSVIGAMGYRTAAVEILRQGEEVSGEIREIVHATASGGTQAGLIAGLAIKRSAVPVLGISAGAPASYLQPLVHNLAAEVIQRIGIDRPIPEAAVVVDDSHVGEAYGVPTDSMREAVGLCARTEGLLLDPVYSGKAMAGLIAHIRAGRYQRDDNVVFIHTGGTPALFSYRDSLS